MRSLTVHIRHASEMLCGDANDLYRIEHLRAQLAQQRRGCGADGVLAYGAEGEAVDTVSDIDHVPADAAEREIESAGFGVADAVPAFADFLGFEFQTFRRDRAAANEDTALLHVMEVEADVLSLAFQDEPRIGL